MEFTATGVLSVFEVIRNRLHPSMVESFAHACGLFCSSPANPSKLCVYVEPIKEYSSAAKAGVARINIEKGNTEKLARMAATLSFWLAIAPRAVPHATP